MSLNLPICHACNTTLSRKERRNITENVTNPPFLGAQLKKCDQMGFPDQQKSWSVPLNQKWVVTPHWSRLAGTKNL